jgi:proteasome component ECM29
MLYSKEINALSIKYLESPKWTIKHTAALTIADVVTSSGTEISRAEAVAIWPALEKALALKTFDGKEKVLESLVRFTKGASILWNAEPSIGVQMKKIAIREAKRQNDEYRSHAFANLGEFSEARVDIDMFDDVCYIVVSPGFFIFVLIAKLHRHRYLKSTLVKTRWTQLMIRKVPRNQMSLRQQQLASLLYFAR